MFVSTEMEELRQRPYYSIDDVRFLSIRDNVRGDLNTRPADSDQKAPLINWTI